MAIQTRSRAYDHRPTETNEVVGVGLSVGVQARLASKWIPEASAFRPSI